MREFALREQETLQDTQQWNPSEILEENRPAKSTPLPKGKALEKLQSASIVATFSKLSQEIATLQYSVDRFERTVNAIVLAIRAARKKNSKKPTRPKPKFVRKSNAKPKIRATPKAKKQKK